MIDRTHVEYEAQKPAALRLLKSTDAIFGTNPLSVLLAHAVLDKYPTHRKQLAAAAEEMGVDVIKLTLANLSYDLLFGMMGCSTMALASPDGPKIVRNMDWFPADLIAKATTVVKTDKGRHAGFPGMVGVVTGMSDYGFGLALNAVGCGTPNLFGYPVLLFLRHVLDTASSFSEAKDMIESQQLMSGGLITLVGTENHQRCVIERTHRNFVTRTPECDGPMLFECDGPLVATNHYRGVAEASECGRYEFMANNIGKMQPLDILENNNVAQSITSQHIVVNPKMQTLQVFVPQCLLECEDEDLSPEELRMLLANEFMQL